MAVSEGWPAGAGRTEAKRSMAAKGRSSARRSSRSLSDALSAAGLGDVGLRGADLEQREASSDGASAEPLMTPRVALFDQPVADARNEAGARPQPASGSQSVSGVVSPAPWQRAARRGRRQKMLVNAFAWSMTLVIAGTIVGLAGRYLAVPPHLQNMQAAQQ